MSIYIDKLLQQDIVPLGHTYTNHTRCVTNILGEEIYMNILDIVCAMEEWQKKHRKKI